MKLMNGEIMVPVRDSEFGQWCDLRSKLPPDCDCIMVLVNSGSGLNAGYPKPIGFIKLPHQLYLKNLEQLIEQQILQARSPNHEPRWITIVPIRSSEYIDVWTSASLDREEKTDMQKLNSHTPHPQPSFGNPNATSALSIFQQQQGQWADRTFPQSTDQSVLAHLKREVAELENATTIEQKIEEASDIFLLLLNYAHKNKFDLLRGAERKHQVNRQRQWGQPDAQGVVSHLK